MIWIHIFSLFMKGETIMDKQLPAIYNDPYISEYFKILYKEHKENKINETKELLDYISNMEKKIDYERLAQNRTALFVTSSPVNPSLHCFINMFYAHTFKQLFEFAEEQPDGKLPIPVHLLADDFGTGCPVPLFDQYISIFREKQISVTIVIQSESQLYSLYGSNEATTIINNCDSYVFFGSNDLYTAKNISIRANKTIDECLHMKVGTEILFRRGDKPKIGKRYNIFKNDIYRKVTEEYQQYITDEEPIKM